MKSIESLPRCEFIIVQDFTISVNGSSCNYLIFGLVLAPLLSLSIYWHPQGMQWDVKKQTLKEKKILRDQKRENFMNCRTHKR